MRLRTYIIKAQFAKTKQIFNVLMRSTYKSYYMIAAVLFLVNTNAVYINMNIYLAIL